LITAFNLFDKEGKGEVVIRDLRRVCKEIGEDVSEAELDMMMAHIDKSGDGAVSLDEWITVMTETL
jgi:centrin-3